MKKDTVFICQNCGKYFSQKESCLEHEHICSKQTFLVYCYEMYFIDEDYTKLEIALTKYKANYSDYNIITLIREDDNSKHIINENEIKFDEVQKFPNGNFYCFTKNILSDNHEIIREKLVNYAEKYFYAKADDIIKIKVNVIKAYVRKEIPIVEDYSKKHIKYLLKF